MGIVYLISILLQSRRQQVTTKRRQPPRPRQQLPPAVLHLYTTTSWTKIIITWKLFIRHYYKKPKSVLPIVIVRIHIFITTNTATVIAVVPCLFNSIGMALLSTLIIMDKLLKQMVLK